MVFQYPFLQPVLPFVQRQIPVLRGFLHQSVSRIVLVGRIDKFIRRERGSTLLTLVAVSTLCSTSRTCTYDIAVGKELSRHLVAELFLCLLYQFALVIEVAEEIRSELMMDV